jgi:hypothetical protein
MWKTYDMEKKKGMLLTTDAVIESNKISIIYKDDLLKGKRSYNLYLKIIY